MVMHARKVPRFNDGYYEKKSSHVHYDENINRYSPKNYSSSNQHTLNSEYCDNRKRKISPSFESCNSKSESISPDRGFSPYKSSQHYNNSKDYKNRSNKSGKLRRQDIKSRSRSKDRSPERSIERRDRSIEKYSERFKDKRERDNYRERYKERSVEKEKKYYEHREYREKEYKKEKYYQRSDCNYSKEKNLNDKRYYEPSSSYYSKEKEKKHGDWTECLSSSGKNYYYNSKTGVSQWDKPKEWSSDNYDQKEHLNFRKEDNYDKYYKKKLDDYEYSKRIENDNSSSSSSNQNYNKSHNKYLNDDYEYDNAYSKNCKWRKEDHLSKIHETKHTKQNGPDDVFSPIEKKTFIKNPQSNGECSKMNNDNFENLIDKNNSLIKSLNSNELSSPSQISKLQKIISQFANLNGLPDLKDLPPQEALRTIQQALQLTSQAKKHSSIKSHKPIDSNSSLSTLISNNVNESPLSSALTRQQQNAIKEHLNLYLKSHHHSMHHHQTIQQHNFHQSTSRQTNNNHTNVSSHQNLHSVDGIRHELDNLLVNKINWAQSPNSDCSLNSSTGSGSSSLVSSASLLDSNTLKSSVPTLTPSLSKYFKQELIAHVANWESEALEKQANRLTEEAHTIGSLNLTRVSAELKMARSLVRLTEIQATLQEQRILFIRQQINNVEEWRSQNLPNFTAFNS